MAVYAVLILFPALMIFSAISDLVTMTISNIVSLILVVGFIVLALVLGLPLSLIGWHLLTGFIVLLVTFAFFAAGWIGGGDAKLAAATSIWLGSALVAQYLLISTIFGGILTITMLTMRNYPWPAILDTVPWIARLYRVDKGIPYGIALGIAGLVVYPTSPIWLSVVG